MAEPLNRLETAPEGGIVTMQATEEAKIVVLCLDWLE